MSTVGHQQLGGEVYFPDLTQVKKHPSIKYLGTLFSATLDANMITQQKLHGRLPDTQTFDPAVDSVWSHQQISTAWKLVVFNAIIRSRIFYTLETLDSKPSHQRTLNIIRGRVDHEVQTVNWEAGKKGLSWQVSRAAWKRRKNRELEAKQAHKPWIREGLNREVPTVNWALSASNIPVFQFTVCTSWFARPWTMYYRALRKILKKTSHLCRQDLDKWETNQPCSTSMFSFKIDKLKDTSFGQ